MCASLLLSLPAPLSRACARSDSQVRLAALGRTQLLLIAPRCARGESDKPRHHALPSTDGWPAEGRPSAARDLVAGGWRFDGKSTVGEGCRQLAEAIGSVETETKAGSALRDGAEG